jgi:hypothetical protein
VGWANTHRKRAVLLRSNRGFSARKGTSLGGFGPHQAGRAAPSREKLGRGGVAGDGFPPTCYFGLACFVPIPTGKGPYFYAEIGVFQPEKALFIENVVPPRANFTVVFAKTAGRM